jgi:hypothetical protein
MFVTMVIAALLVDVLFSGLGLVPQTRPSTEDVFGSIELDYKAALNLLGAVIFATLMLLRGPGTSGAHEHDAHAQHALDGA